MASALKTNPSSVTELDLSHNQLHTVSRANLLFSGLESPNCRLKTLRLVSRFLFVIQIFKEWNCHNPQELVEALCWVGLYEQVLFALVVFAPHCLTKPLNLSSSDLPMAQIQVLVLWLMFSLGLKDEVPLHQGPSSVWRKTAQSLMGLAQHWRRGWSQVLHRQDSRSLSAASLTSSLLVQFFLMSQLDRVLHLMMIVLLCGF